MTLPNTLLQDLREKRCQYTGLSFYDIYKKRRYERMSYQDFQNSYNLDDNDTYQFGRRAYDLVVDIIATHTAEGMRSKILESFSRLRETVEDIFDECGDCGEICVRDNMIYVAGQDAYIGECCEQNYRFHEGHDEYYHEDDYPYDDEDEDDYRNGIHGYDYDVTNELLEHRRNNETRLLGLEAEVERRNDCSSDIAEDIASTLQGFALCKHDGSLSNGFEIVTAPATISAQKEYWNKFCQKNYSDSLSAWHTSTCGMHIHVDRSSLTPLDIGKLLVFINSPHNAQFVEKIAGRDSKQWCNKGYKTIKDALNRSDKYEALATHKPRTIEFRLFRGNIAKQGIFRNLEFVDSLCNFVNTVGLDKNTDSVNSLSYTNFIKYMNRSENKGSYPYLFSWLVRKGYNKGRTKNIQNESEES